MSRVPSTPAASAAAASSPPSPSSSSPALVPLPAPPSVSWWLLGSAVLAGAALARDASRRNAGLPRRGGPELLAAALRSALGGERGERAAAAVLAHRRLALAASGVLLLVGARALSYAVGAARRAAREFYYNTSPADALRGEYLLECDDAAGSGVAAG